MDESADPGLERRMRDVRPSADDLEGALARARVEQAIFGSAPTVRIGRYEVEQRAGVGGGGEVYAARDPELSRPVAIKLIRTGGHRDRVIAEGHALAKLSHPNVVPIHDVGTIDDRVYLVMELVEGETLRAYCTAERPVRDVVRVYRQAGEGLAAAHRAGFVHRDFKPDNAVVGKDGRVRVIDFGLARAGAPASIPPGGGDGEVAIATRAGLGTPRYMAPEQHTGKPLTPAVDQFAFCKSLRESLGDRMPRWIASIVERGTANEPGDRFPSMDRLVVALSRDPAARWRRRGAIAGAVGVAALAFVVGRSDGGPPACDGGAAELAAVWNAETRARLAAHVDQLAAPYARTKAPWIGDALDAYASAWRAGHKDACTAHRRGAQSADLLDRRMVCLARGRAALGAAVGVVAASDADNLPSAISAIVELPELSRCADEQALATAIAPPAPPIADRVRVLSDELAALEVEVRGARPDARAKVTEAIATAREVGYRPVLARALRLGGVAAIDAREREAAVPLLAEATTLALAVGDHVLAVEAYARRAYTAGTTGDPDRALAGYDLVDALASNLPQSGRAARALLVNNLGTVELAAGRNDRARAAFERALELAAEVTGPEAIELAQVRNNVALVIDDRARAEQLDGEAAAILSTALGTDHPSTLDTLILGALMRSHPERSRAALEPACATYVEMHPERGRPIANCSFQVGWLAHERGDAVAARAAFGRAVAAEASGARNWVGLSRAYVALLDGDAGAAAAGFSALVGEGGGWWDAYTDAEARLGIGFAARSLGHTGEARAAFEAAMRSMEKVVAVRPTAVFARRLARARVELVRTIAGPLSPALRAHADAAIAWCRTAGGYDAVIDELRTRLDSP